MTTDEQLALHENYWAVYRGLADQLAGGVSRTFGAVEVVATDLTFPEYNRAFVFDDPDPDAFSAAVGWLVDRDRPFWVTISDAVVDSIGNLPAEVGLTISHADPGMVLTDLEDVASNDAALEVVPVTDEDSLLTFVDVFSTVFDRPTEPMMRAYRPGLSDDRTHMVVGVADGHPVACGLVVRTGEVAGLYAVGVRESHRRQGFGEQMTNTLLEIGREAGCRLAVLQSSEMATSLYDRMGFDQVTTYHHFEPSS